MKISCMQPYLYPYSGYYRLFAATDLFVILDDVQFMRRGRVHRYQIGGEWFTLPILKTDRDTTMIKDLKWKSKLNYPCEPCEFIIDKLKETCEKLAIPFLTVRSSSMNIPDHLRGQDRIIYICKKIGATEYINSPGGNSLYDEKAFMAEDIKLTFLRDWKGNYNSIVYRLDNERPEDIRREIYEQI